MKDCNGTRKRTTKILRKSTESGDFQQKVESPGCPNPRLNGGRLLPTSADVSTLPLQSGEHEVGRGKCRPARIPFLRSSLSSRAYTQKLSIPGGNQEKAVREIHMEC